MTLTLRDIPLELDAALRTRADREHRPVDQVAVEAMKAGLGIVNRTSNPIQSANLATAIRNRFGPLGGLELPDPVREPMREPLSFDE